MKLFLGIDLTTDKENFETDGDVFLIEKPSLELKQTLDDLSEKAVDAIDESTLSLPAQIIKWIFGIIGVSFALAIIRVLIDENDVSLNNLYQNSSFMFWICGISLMIWGVLTFVSVRKSKNFLKSEESDLLLEKLEKTQKAIFDELNVSNIYREVDVLSFYYKTKDGKFNIYEKTTESSSCFNSVFKIFADSEFLYLVDVSGKYAFPLASLKSIEKIEKTVVIPNWNKAEECNKGIYKQYKLKKDDLDNVVCKYYHVLKVDHINEEWGIYFPCYELPVFEELTGLKDNDN